MRALHLKKNDYHKIDLENFPNFHKSGSIKGMKNKFYGKDALLVKYGSFIYKVDKPTYELVENLGG